MMRSSRYLKQHCAICSYVNQVLIPPSALQGLIDQIFNFLNPNQIGISFISKDIFNFCTQCTEILQEFLNMSKELERIEKALGNCANQLQLKIYNSNQIGVEDQNEKNFRNIFLSSLDLLNGRLQQGTSTRSYQNASSICAPRLTNSSFQSWPNENQSFESTPQNSPTILQPPPPQEEINADNYLDGSTQSFTDYDEDQQPAKKSKNKKVKRKADTNSSSSTKPKRLRAAASDTFGPITNVQGGRLFFEGYEILKLPTGFHQCLLCSWTEGCNGPNWMKMRTIKIHIAGVHIGKYKCNACSKTFKSIAILKNHQKTCQIPPQVKEDLLKTCPVCSKKVKLLQTHLWVHKTKEEKSLLISQGKAPPSYQKEKLKCPHCPKQFNFSLNYKKHLNGCGVNNLKRERKTSKINSLEDKECEICGRIVTEIAYEAHLWTHKNKLEKEESKERNEVPILVQRKQAIKKDAMCTVCGFVTWKTYLPDHMNTHKEKKDKKMFRCDFPGCEKEFTSRPVVRSHMYETHNLEKNAKWFRCTADGCTVKYIKKLYLDRHYSRIHVPKENYKDICDICNARLACKYDLGQHKKNSHAKGKNDEPEMYKFQCPEENCLMKFVNPAQLSYHLDRKHKEIEEKEIKVPRRRGRPKKQKIKEERDDETEDEEEEKAMGPRNSQRKKTKIIKEKEETEEEIEDDEREEEGTDFEWEEEVTYKI